MKKIAGLLLMAVLLPWNLFTAYAAVGIDEIRTAYESGQLIFDEAGLFTEEEEAGLQRRAESLSDEAGLDLAVFTAEDTFSFDGAEDLADYVYYEGGFGRGEDASGAMLVIDMGHREYFVYTKGEAARYLTDSALEWMTEEDIAPALSEGYYSMAADTFLTDADAYIRGGVQSDQYLYNEETGERDYAVPRHRLHLWECLCALILSGVIAYLPCRSVKKRYAMEAEKKNAQGFLLAYRADAKFALMPGEADAKLVNRFVNTVPIVRQNGNRNGRGGGFSGMGGGRSTMRMGRGGGMHGGRGGKF